MKFLHTFLLFYFFLIPFQWALSPVAGIDLALLRVITLVVCLLWLGVGLTRKKIVLPSLLATFFLSAFLLVVALSFFWAGEREFALRKIIFLWTFLPLFFVISSLMRETLSLREKIARSFIWGAFVVSLVGITQFFAQFVIGVERLFSFWVTTVLPFFLGGSFGQSVATYPSLLVNIQGKTLMRASGFFPDPHMFSLYLGLALPLAGYFFWSSPRAHRYGWIFIFSSIFLADLLSFSRGGYVGVAFGLFIWFILLAFQKKWNVKKLLITLGIVFVSSLLLGGSPFGSRLWSSFSFEDGSNVERLRLWGEAVGHVAECPVFGTGIGNYPLLVKPSASYREPIYAHNLFLDIALETGLVGLSFFVGLLFLGLSRALRAWKNTGDAFSLSLLISLVVFSAHAFFETPLFSVHVLPALLFILAASIL